MIAITVKGTKHSMNRWTPTMVLHFKISANGTKQPFMQISTVGQSAGSVPSSACSDKWTTKVFHVISVKVCHTIHRNIIYCHTREAQSHFSKVYCLLENLLAIGIWLVYLHWDVEQSYSLSCTLSFGRFGCHQHFHWSTQTYMLGGLILKAWVLYF